MIKEEINTDGFIKALTIFKPGQCRKCGHPANVLSVESYILELNPVGIPVRHIPVNLKCVGFCPRCNTFMNVEPKDSGMGFKIDSNPITTYKTIKNYDPVSPKSNPFLKSDTN